MLEAASRPGANLGRVLLLAAASLLVGAQYAPTPGESIHAAVRSGNRQEVRQLLAHGVDVDTRDRLGGTPLLDAAWTGDLAMVELLLAKGADVNATHAEAGSTALEYAVLTSRPEIVKALLVAHADIRHRYRSNQNIMHIAAGRGDVAVLNELLRAGAPLQGLDAEGRTPLDQAVLHDRLAATRFLLAHGDSAGEHHAADGRGPLHEACVKGFADLIPVLMQAGVSPGDRDASGQSPLDLALAYKNVDAVKALLNAGGQGGGSVRSALQAASSAMENATMRGQIEIVQLLLDSGFDANRRTPSGTTYLHDAALKGKVRVASLLLDSGVRLDARNQSGATALHDAALGGSAKVIGLLLDRGAAIDAVDDDSRATPLMLAASLARDAAVDLLLQRGADWRLRDREGMTALERAVRSGDTGTVRLLRAAQSSGKAK